MRIDVFFDEILNEVLDYFKDLLGEEEFLRFFRVYEDAISKYINKQKK